MLPSAQAIKYYQNLKHIDDLIWYEGPFLSEFSDGHLMYWLCQDDDCNVWSLLKTHELSELKNGKKSLRDIIVGSEQIAIFRIDNNLEIREVIFEPMKEEWLPAADYDLGYFTTI